MFKEKMVAKSMRALCVGLLLCVAACSSSTGGSSNAGMSRVFPAGIAPFKNATAAVDAGLYPGNERICCFLGPRASLTLQKPAGALSATFSFYVPKVAAYATGETMTVAAAGKSVSGSLTSSPGRRIVITLELPPSVREQTMIPVTITASKSFVPSKLGMNGDTRNLSVVLTKVEYL